VLGFGGAAVEEVAGIGGFGLAKTGHADTDQPKARPVNFAAQELATGRKDFCGEVGGFRR
jgi:hypothetical protein